MRKSFFHSLHLSWFLHFFPSIHVRARMHTYNLISTINRTRIIVSMKIYSIVYFRKDMEREEKKDLNQNQNKNNVKKIK